MIVWASDVTKPMYEIDLQCKICKEEAVAMTVGDDSVQWCARGHVVHLVRDQVRVQFSILNETEVKGEE